VRDQGTGIRDNKIKEVVKIGNCEVMNFKKYKFYIRRKYETN